MIHITVGCVRSGHTVSDTESRGAHQSCHPDPLDSLHRRGQAKPTLWVNGAHKLIVCQRTLGLGPVDIVC